MVECSILVLLNMKEHQRVKIEISNKCSHNIQWVFQVNISTKFPLNFSYILFWQINSQLPSQFFCFQSEKNHSSRGSGQFCAAKESAEFSILGTRYYNGEFLHIYSPQGNSNEGENEPLSCDCSRDIFGALLHLAITNRSEIACATLILSCCMQES